MERLDDNDVNRRITEIYSRKRGVEIEEKKQKIHSIYKFLLQCLLIVNFATIILSVKYKNMIFSEAFLNQVDCLYKENIENKVIAFFSEDENSSDKNTQEIINQNSN